MCKCAHFVVLHPAGADGFELPRPNHLERRKVHQDHSQLETIQETLGETTLLALKSDGLDARNPFQ